MRAALVVLGLILVPLPAVAQPSAAPTAASVLAQVDQASAAIKTAAVKFAQVVTDPTTGIVTKSRGRLWTDRPNLRVDYLATQKGKTEARRTLIVDKAVMTVIDKPNLQVIQSGVCANMTPAALSFLTGQGSLAASFTPALGAVTATTIELELTPTQPSASYAQLMLLVDATTFAVKESTVTDPAGRTNRMVFTAMQAGVAVKPSLFVVNLKGLAKRSFQIVQQSMTCGTGSGSGSGSATP